MKILTDNLIAGVPSAEGSHKYRALDAAQGSEFGPEFTDASTAEIDRACEAAAEAYPVYADLSLEERARFLETAAERIEATVDTLVEQIPAETGLPEARVRGELGRTCGQLRLFATVVRRGDFLEARIDPAQPDREPAPRPDVRTCRLPVGPVAVFGASNFPLAFSVAGGDTASALAAGCPVVVKAHPGHPGASAVVADAIRQAVEDCGLPAGVFSLLHGAQHAVGGQLVKHPAIKSVGFTGSFKGGTAIARLAAERPEPIPVHAEMGSINPMFLLPEVLAEKGESLAQGYIGSVNMGCGQFCTSPGVVFAARSPELDTFIRQASEAVEASGPGVMLHSGILAAYEEGAERIAAVDGVEQVAEGSANEGRARTRLYRVSLETYRNNPVLSEEVFGPATIVVEVPSAADFADIARELDGQLTATVHASDKEVANYAELVRVLQHRAGRVLFNGFPTGVEVCDSMIHGGPWPATTDGRTTSVGTLAIDRYLRPVCYQDCPQPLLPAALHDSNPLGLQRLVNGEWSTAGV